MIAWVMQRIIPNIERCRNTKSPTQINNSKHEPYKYLKDMYLNNKLTFYFVIFFLMVTTSSCTAQEQPSLASQKDYTSFVNPFIGTAPLLDPDIIGYTP